MSFLMLMTGQYGLYSTIPWVTFFAQEEMTRLRVFGAELVLVMKLLSMIDIILVTIRLWLTLSTHLEIEYPMRTPNELFPV